MAVSARARPPLSPACSNVARASSYNASARSRSPPLSVAVPSNTFARATTGARPAPSPAFGGTRRGEHAGEVRDRLRGGGVSGSTRGSTGPPAAAARIVSVVASASFDAPGAPARRRAAGRTRRCRGRSGTASGRSRSPASTPGPSRDTRPRPTAGPRATAPTTARTRGGGGLARLSWPSVDQARPAPVRQREARVGRDGALQPVAGSQRVELVQPLQALGVQPRRIDIGRL